MQAKEAREIAKQARSQKRMKDETVAANWLETIFKQIKKLAEEGEQELRNPFDGVRTLAPTPEQTTIIFNVLKENGFVVEHYNFERGSDVTVKW